MLKLSAGNETLEIYPGFEINTYPYQKQRKE
jgi:hypothetical protein